MMNMKKVKIFIVSIPLILMLIAVGYRTSIVEENSLVKQTSSENKLEVTIKNEQFDLALRKFITKITTNEGKENEKVQDITNRIPEEDTEELKTGVDTTAKYNHTKDPISLYAGDTEAGGILWAGLGGYH